MFPQSVGPYRILKLLGSGGMGRVYLAEDDRLRRLVALKSLTEAALKPDTQRQLLHEARTAAALNHPNIAAIYDVIEAPEGAFIVMEYVAGQTLAERLRSGPLNSSTVSWIGIQLCEALEEAHAHGIVHRDIKPSNLILTPEGRLKVLDFGLAKRLVIESGEASDTRSDADLSGGGRRLVGTPQYCPPEHLLGKTPDARGDIYSTGIVLYELITGQRPFSGPTSAALASAILNETPRSPGELTPRVPRDLERVVLKAMARSPAERHPTAAALKLDLARAGEALSSAPTEVAPFFERTTRRRLIARSAAIAGFVLVVAGAAVLLGRSRPTMPRLVDAAGASVVVVPFENATGDPAWTYLADGIADDLARQLQSFGVPLKSRGSAARLRGLSDPDIAKRLGVARVARGRISFQGDAVVLDTRITEAATGAELWSRSYRRSRSRLGGLYALVAADLAAWSTTARPTAPAGPIRETTFRAYEAYHKGRVYWEQRDRDGLSKAIEYFEQATRLDPEYAQAWAGIADAYLGLGVPTFGALQPQESRRLANSAALRALELNPNLAEVQTTLAQIAYAYDWNWSAAEDRFVKAIALNPQYVPAHHWYADYLTSMGRPEDAMREIQVARQLEPLSSLIHRDVAWHLFFKGDYDSAIAELDQTLDLDPGHVPTRSLLGRALIERGRHAEGLAVLRAVAPELPRGAALAFEAYGEAAAGQARRAEALLVQLRTLDRDYVSPYYVALIHTRLGQKNEALDWLQKGLDDRDSTMTSLNIDPRLEPLRTEPRFESLVRRMNFPVVRPTHVAPTKED